MNIELFVNTVTVLEQATFENKVLKGGISVIEQFLSYQQCFNSVIRLWFKFSINYIYTSVGGL